MIRKRKHRRYCRLAKKLQAKEYKYMSTVVAAKSCIKVRDERIAGLNREMELLHGLTGYLIKKLGGKIELSDHDIAGLRRYGVLVHPDQAAMTTHFISIEAEEAKTCQD